MAEGEGNIYSATYSNVPVYELKVSSDHVMRRRSDDWINATHILKIAGFDKPARTRILEREVQKGVHEKIQGGYGKYQGTWVPLADGRALAEKNGILKKIFKVFDFIPGDQSPPPAPKHTTAASNRPKPAKPSSQPRKPQSNAYYRPSNEAYDNMSTQFNDENSDKDLTPDSASFFEEETFPLSRALTRSRKRKRGMDSSAFTNADMEHTVYGDELLDYFVAAGEDGSAKLLPPVPPRNFEVNRAIDSHGNNALHWACAMGDLSITKDLLSRGANPAAQNGASGETPLIRAVLFTNNHDKQSFPKIVQLLQNTITERDWHGATVFHHIAETARSRSKWNCARYYCEVLVNKLIEMGPTFVPALLTAVDKNHDPAVLCAIRNNCVKVASFLLNHCPEAGEIANLKGETANEFFRSLSEKRASLEIPSSSPLRAGESYGNRRKSGKRASKEMGSRAASNVLTKVGSVIEEAAHRLANMYEAEMNEKDTIIAEAKVNLATLEAERHRIRSETFALLAKVENEQEFSELRAAYERLLRETEGLLEQREHAKLQSEVLEQDMGVNPEAFRSANPNKRLTQEEMHTSLPLVIELAHQQAKRRTLVKQTVHAMSEASAGETLGKHRKLVAAAAGVREDQIDAISEALLEILKATQPIENDTENDGQDEAPRTPDGAMDLA